MKSETNLSCMWEQGVKNKVIFMAETPFSMKSLNQLIKQLCIPPIFPLKYSIAIIAINTYMHIFLATVYDQCLGEPCRIQPIAP